MFNNFFSGNLAVYEINGEKYGAAAKTTGGNITEHQRFTRCLVHETATYRCDDTRGCVMQFWPPDDEYMCSKHVEAWNKTYCETNFVHQVG